MKSRDRSADRALEIATAPKTATFQMRINPVVKDRAEAVYAKCGLSMTEAINVFLQQSINANGIPFRLTAKTRERAIK